MLPLSRVSSATTGRVLMFFQQSYSLKVVEMRGSCWVLLTYEDWQRLETGNSTAYSRFLTWALEADAPSSRKEEKHARRAKEALETDRTYVKGSTKVGRPRF